MAETPSTFTLTPGAEAPDFTLPSADGTLHSLQEIAGKMGTLVIFACNHCPYVIMMAKKLGELAEKWHSLGVSTVAISSNDIRDRPEDGPEYMPEFAAKNGWKFPYLRDDSQEVAQAYDAACTPDFFLFDADLRLYYAGQFDDSRPKNGKAPSGKDLDAAVDALLAGETPPSDPKPSTGCNIKWLPGKAPKWHHPVKKDS